MAGIREFLGAALQVSLRGQGFMNDFVNSINWPGLPLERLATPALVMHGSLDVFIRLEDFVSTAHKIPGAKFIPLEGAGHEALTAWIDQIKSPVLDFLRLHMPPVPVS